MSLDLYIGPRRNRRGRVMAWLGLTLLIAGVVAWQWGWQPEEWKDGLEASPWLKLFQNAREWCEKH